ncbi:MAG: bifunctional pyr operon transcriptional regulator/uracil phosphoribosyltransferase PyrR [Candidatus Sumerlaeota bacterium]
MENSETDDRQLLEADEIRRLIERICEDVVEMVRAPERLALVGIRTHGVTLARRIQNILKDKHGWDVPMGIVDITLYRDDLGHRESQPIVRPTEIDFDIEGRVVVLVDDVIATGRTIRCALDEIISFGRPDAIRLTVLVDRGRREFPIQPDIVGEVVEADADQRVEVRLDEEGQADAVWVAAAGSLSNS